LKPWDSFSPITAETTRRRPRLAREGTANHVPRRQDPQQEQPGYQSILSQLVAAVAGLTISSDVVAVHVAVSDERRQALTECWHQNAEEPAQRAGRPAPRLVILESPYRRLFMPLIDFVENLQKEHPSRQVAVIVPELVQRHWYENFLHNHRAEVLKARLLFNDNERVALINIPWYLK
jgi:hypothetical protein